jgi:hypothetical protein
MKIRSNNVVSFYEAYLGKLMILLGAGFLVIGILFTSSISSLFVYSWMSATGFFAGVILLGLGFLVQVGFYTKRTFLGKISSILTTASFVFFAGLLAATTYRELLGTRFISTPYGEVERIIPLLSYPFASFIVPLLIAGISSFVVGVALRFHMGRS